MTWRYGMKTGILTVMVSLILALSSSTSAQPVNWQKIANFSYVYALAITASGDIFAAAGDTLYRSTDDGVHWSPMVLKLQPYNGIQYLVIAPNGNIFACSEMGSIYRSTDNGDTWTLLNTPANTTILGMACDSAGRLFIAGCFGGVMRSIDNGETWQTVLTNADIHGIVVGPSGDVIAGCFAGRGNRPGGFRSTDNGTRWQPYDIGFTSLSWNSSGTMFACNGCLEDFALSGIIGGGGPNIFRSKNNGLSWDTTAPRMGYDVLVTADGQVLAGGEKYVDRYGFSQEGGIITSLDNGDTWVNLSVGLTSDCVYALEKNSRGEIFAGTRDGVFHSIRTSPIEFINSDFYVHPSGDKMNSGVSPSQPIRSITDALSRIAADKDHPRTIYIANGRYNKAATGEAGDINVKSYVSLIGESEEGVILEGTQLAVDNCLGVSIERMSFIDAAINAEGCSPVLRNLTMNGSVGNSSGGSQRLRRGSPEASTSAKRIVPPMTSAHEPHPALNPSSAQGVTIGYGPGIRLSGSNALIEDVHIGGTTYDAGILMYGSSPTLRDVTLIRNTGWLSGGIRIEENSNPMVINSTIADNSGSELGAVHCNSGSHPIFVNTIIWNNSSPSIELHSFPNEDCSIAFSHCIVQGGVGNILLKNEGGSSSVLWMDGNMDMDPLFVDADHGDYRLRKNSPCMDAGTSVVIRDGDTLMHLTKDQYRGLAPDVGAYEYSDATGISADLSVPVSTMLNQNFPNPFNPTTTIRYAIARSGWTQLKIFNVLGREVATLVNEVKQPGTYSVQWDASGVPSGVYYYRMQSGEYMSAKKMLVLK